MKVLLLGSGGRENALAWGLSRSHVVTELVAAPGNPGIATYAELVNVRITDTDQVVDVARRLGVDLVVVGPEAPLVEGVGDALRAAGIAVFGPDAQAAQIEGSKAHAKSLMERAGIATAAWRSFAEPDPAIAYLDELGPPYVIKADGLAAGKGVLVTEDRDEAVGGIEERLVDRRFGEAGNSIVIEEFLGGQETSLIAFVDGKNVVACEPAQDYKRALDDDRGPNTGGMGSYSPVPACPPQVARQIVEEVIAPMVRQTASEGAPFVGALYAGLALTSTGPKVIEFNARFGDPETQALVPRLESDLGEVTMACATGSLSGVELKWTTDACVSVVLASEGYPGAFQDNKPITGVSEASAIDGVQVFHSGTRVDGDRLVTAGGRVLAVSATGPSFAVARERANKAASAIDFEGKQMRSDIGLRAERAEGGSS